MQMMLTPRPGYVFLIAVLFIGAIALVSSMSMLLLAWAWEQNGKTFSDAGQALEMARSCVDYALTTLRDNASYAGNETVTFSSTTSCTVLDIQGSGNDYRTLCVEGRSGTVVKRLVLTISQILPSPVISSYTETNNVTGCSPAASSSSSSS